MRVLAIDPGTTQSAYVLCTKSGSVILKGTLPNAEMLEQIDYLANHAADVFVVEMIASYGMPVGAEVFETCVWIGRFMQRWSDSAGTEPRTLFRRDVKLHLCGSPRAKDANIRQALLDRFGGKAAIGTKRDPGPLHGIRKDEWAALAVAITYSAQWEHLTCEAKP